MSNYPVLLIHGYSDKGGSFGAWEEKLRAAGFDARLIRVATWQSLVNEISIADVAEGLDRALAIEPGLKKGEPFSVIAHSTGSLVVRAWLAADPQRRGRLRHFIGLAPANFGSPLAHKGRSFLAAMAKGNKEFGENFLEVGDQFLDALELGSRFTWDLAEKDLLAPATSWYGDGEDSPWAYTICGTGKYNWLKQLFTDPDGSDGVVRWAGSALDARKITIDLSRKSGGDVRVDGERTRDVPTAFVSGRHHGAMLKKPTGNLERMVLDALKVDSPDSDKKWREKWESKERPASRDVWQQFVVRVRDERGDPVPDYNMQLDAIYDSGERETLSDFAAQVHPYKRDPSFRAFHVRLRDIRRTKIKKLGVKILARTNSSLVGYRGVGGSSADGEGGSGKSADAKTAGGWNGELDISELGPSGDVKLFWPFTTTMIEVVLDREPRPYDGVNRVFRFGG